MSHPAMPFRARRRAAVLSLLAAAPLAARTQVVATTTDLASIAREVGSDLVEVDAIATGVQNPHFVDAKPSFLLKLQKADLFIQVGLELELGCAPTLLANPRSPRIRPGASGFVDASAGVEQLEVPLGVDRSAGDIHGYGTPHCGLDPANGHRVAANIAAGLKRIDAALAAANAASLAAFDARLDTALARRTKRIVRIEDGRIVEDRENTEAT